MGNRKRARHRNRANSGNRTPSKGQPSNVAADINTGNSSLTSQRSPSRCASPVGRQHLILRTLVGQRKVGAVAVNNSSSYRRKRRSSTTASHRQYALSLARVRQINSRVNVITTRNLGRYTNRGYATGNRRNRCVISRKRNVLSKIPAANKPIACRNLTRVWNQSSLRYGNRRDIRYAAFAADGDDRNQLRRAIRASSYTSRV